MARHTPSAASAASSAALQRPPARWPQPARSYGLALVLVMAALVVRWLFAANGLEFGGCILLAAVAITASLGGSGAALLATSLSTVVIFLGVGAEPGSASFAILFALAALTVAWTVARGHRNESRTLTHRHQALQAAGNTTQQSPTPVVMLESSDVLSLQQFKLFTAILENIRDAIIVTEAEPLDEPGPRIIYANTAFLKMTGYSRDEVLGRSPRFLQGPQTSSNSRAIIRQALERHEPCRVELIHYTKDGKPYWVELDLTPVIVPSPNTRYIIAIQRDITARKQVEEELRKSEIRYRSLVHAVSAVTWTAPPGGSLIGPQPSWLAFTGQSDEEMANYGCTKAIHPDDLPVVIERWQEALRLQRPYESVHRIRRHDGQWRWMKTYAAPIHDENGQVIEWFGIHIDITSEREAIEELERRKQELQTLLDHVPVVISRFDRQLRHLFVSGAIEPITGQPASEFLGKTNRELGMPPELCDYWDRLMKAVFQEGRPQVGEFTFPSPNGPRHFEIKLVPEPNRDGSIATILGVAIDVTVRRTAQEAIRQRDELLRKLTDQVPGVLYQYREWPDGRSSFPYASAGIQQIFEVSPEQVIESGDFLFSWIHPDDYAMVRDSIDASKTHLHEWHCEFRMILPRSGLRWLEGHSQPERCPDGSTLWHGYIRDITERKNAEQKIRSSEERFRTLVENVQVGVVVVDAHGQITLANLAAAQILGLQHHQFQGQWVFDPCWEIVREDGRLWEIDELPFSIALRTGQPVRDVIVGSRHQKTGQRLWLQVNATPEQVGDGSIASVILTFIDITRLKQTEQELRLKESAIAESLNGIIFTDLNQTITYANRAFLTMWGYDGDHQVIGRPLRDLWQDESTANSISAALAQSGTIRGEFGGRCGDGRSIVIQLTANIIHGTPHQAATIVLSLQDITEQKRVELAKQKAEQRQQLALTAGKMGTWDWQIGTERLVWDVRESQIMGFSANAFDGRLSSFLSLIHVDDRPLIRQALLDAAKGRGFDGEFRIVCPSGEMRWIHGTGTVYRDENDRSWHLVGINYDVTDRKQVENQLRQTNQLLQSLSRLQQDFLLEAPPQNVFQEMLAVLLQCTQSEYGFLGEVHRDASGQPYLHTQAISDIAWDEATRQLYAEKARSGMIFTNLNTLFGHVLTTGQPLISNDPENDPRSYGLPPGHPPLYAFLGVPLYRGHELVGMVGVANRPGGYSEAVLETIQPLISTCSSLIYAHQLQQQRRAMEESLRASLHEKEALLKEIHHRVKNNLQVISSLLNLQAERLTDAASRAVFLESQNRVRAMALVHETLYGSASLAQIELPRYLERLCDSLAQTYPGSDRITIHQNAAPIMLDLDRALPVGLIVSELVSNALKYAFPPPRSGQIRVVASTTEDGYIVLQVADNGVGLPDDFRVEGANSLGLYLVQLLTRQLRGQIAIDRTSGTTFSLRFPL
ncbi:MAG: PAS domain S-box protein [Gemmataceae bacterium]|nr:PAS domain S-box protein [Gemmata sp.]MDW8199204.1 PAS domain S-box protein [Gemmataceae bacterium]